MPFSKRWRHREAATGRYTAPGESETDVSLVARAMPLERDPSRTIGDALLEAEATLFLDGHAAAAPLLRSAVAAIDDDPSDTEEMMRWLGIGSWAAGAIGDEERALRFVKRLERVT